MSEIVDLTWERKKLSDNNTELSPADLLRMALEDVERGDYPHASKCMILIVETDETPGVRAHHHYYRAGMERVEEVGYLAIWTQRTIERMQE